MRAADPRVHEWMGSAIDEVKQASGGPHITLEGILLVLELLG